MGVTQSREIKGFRQTWMRRGPHEKHWKTSESQTMENKPKLQGQKT